METVRSELYVLIYQVLTIINIIPEKEDMIEKWANVLPYWLTNCHV